MCRPRVFSERKAHSTLDESFVAAHRLRRAHLLLRCAAADHVQAIECGFCGDLLREALELKTRLLNPKRKVLADFAPVDGLADARADLVPPAECTALDAGTDFLELSLVCLQQRLALVSA